MNENAMTLEFSRCGCDLEEKQDFHNLVVFRFVICSCARNQLNNYSKGRGYDQFNMAISVLSSYFFISFLYFIAD